MRRTALRKASLAPSPRAMSVAVRDGITFASVVMAGASRSSSSWISFAKLSTSPFRAATAYGSGVKTACSWFRGWAFSSLTTPTLAHRVCARTSASTPGWERIVWSSRSFAIFARSARTLSPSSPTSAATFHTNDHTGRLAGSWASRTASLLKSVIASRRRRSSSRFGGSAAEAPRTRRWIPAESRPRTSRRSSAFNARFRS